MRDTHMHRLLPVVALMLAPALVWADTPPPPELAAPQPVVKLPATIKVHPGKLVTVKASTNGGPIRWYLPDRGLEPVDLEALLGPEAVKGSTARLFQAPDAPGTFRVVAVAAMPDAAGKVAYTSPFAICEVVVSGPAPPVPPAPVPPTPTPAKQFRALIVYETGDLSRLPASQRAALYAKEIRDYLNARCAKGPDGKTAEWRLWDANVDASAESQAWKDALARPRASLPWVVLMDGDKVTFEGPLPATVADTMKLLKTYGG